MLDTLENWGLVHCTVTKIRGRLVRTRKYMDSNGGFFRCWVGCCFEECFFAGNDMTGIVLLKVAESGNIS